MSEVPTRKGRLQLGQARDVKVQVQNRRCCELRGCPAQRRAMALRSASLRQGACAEVQADEGPVEGLRSGVVRPDKA